MIKNHNFQQSNGAHRRLCIGTLDLSIDTCRRLGHDATNTTQQGRQPAHDNAITCCNGIDMPLYGPFRAKLASSIKREVRDISQRRQRRTELRQQITCTKNSVKIGRAVLEICSRTDAQTDTQTDTLVTILGFPAGGGVTN